MACGCGGERCLDLESRLGKKIEEEFGGFQGGCGEQNLIRLETQAIVRNFWIELG
jgi:hypothetical protein